MKIVSPTELTLEALDCTKPCGFLYWRTSQSLYDSNVQSESYTGRLVGSVSPMYWTPREYPVIWLRTRIPQISVQQPELWSQSSDQALSLTIQPGASYFTSLSFGFPSVNWGDNTLQIGVLRTKQHWVYKMLSTMPGA